MALNIDFLRSFGNSTYCDDLPTSLKYWIPVVLKNYSDHEYHWSSDSYPKDNVQPPELKWATSQPNSCGIDKCVGMVEISGKYLANDYDCESPACSVCKIPDFNLFYLRGEGPKNLLNRIS